MWEREGLCVCMCVRACVCDCPRLYTTFILSECFPFVIDLVWPIFKVVYYFNSTWDSWSFVFCQTDELILHSRCVCVFWLSTEFPFSYQIKPKLAPCLSIASGDRHVCRPTFSSCFACVLSVSGFSFLSFFPFPSRMRCVETMHHFSLSIQPFCSLSLSLSLFLCKPITHVWSCFEFN